MEDKNYIRRCAVKAYNELKSLADLIPTYHCVNAPIFENKNFRELAIYYLEGKLRDAKKRGELEARRETQDTILKGLAEKLQK